METLAAATPTLAMHVPISRRGRFQVIMLCLLGLREGDWIFGTYHVWKPVKTKQVSLAYSLATRISCVTGHNTLNGSVC